MIPQTFQFSIRNKTSLYYPKRSGEVDLSPYVIYNTKWIKARILIVVRHGNQSVSVGRRKDRNELLCRYVQQVSEKFMQFFSFNSSRMADQCFKKCIPKYNDGDLNTGEMVCVDRCVAKYFEVLLVAVLLCVYLITVQR